MRAGARGGRGDGRSVEVQNRPSTGRSRYRQARGRPALSFRSVRRPAAAYLPRGGTLGRPGRPYRGCAFGRARRREAGRDRRVVAGDGTQAGHWPDPDRPRPPARIPIGTRTLVLYAGLPVEVAAASAIEAAPRHSWTDGLLMSEPPVDRKLESLRASPGGVPEPDGVTGRGRCAAKVGGRWRRSLPAVCPPARAMRRSAARCRRRARSGPQPWRCPREPHPPRCRSSASPA